MTEQRPAPQVLTPAGIQSEEKVHVQPKPTPPPQVLVPKGLKSEEKVHELPKQFDLNSLTDDQKKLFIKLLDKEAQLRRRASNNLKKRSNILSRVNSLRVRLGLPVAELKDYK